MKKAVLLFLIGLLSFSANAQTNKTITDSVAWFPIGASWYYNKQEMVEFNAHGYIKYTVEKDTIVESILVKKISTTEYLYNGKKNIKENIFVHTANNQVYRLYGKELQLVYDYNLTAGDTLKLKYDILSELCYSFSPMILDSIGEIIVERDTLWVQFFTYYEKMFEDSEVEKRSYRVIEKIGNTGDVSDFLKTKHICSYESSPLNTLLRCYIDNDTYYKANWLQEQEKECDYLIDKTTASTYIHTNDVNIYPNPVKNILHIDYPNMGFSLIVYNILGCKILQEDNCTVLNVNSLPNGIYFLQVYNRHNRIKMYKFFKE